MCKDVRCTLSNNGVEATSVVSYTQGMKTAISIPDDVFNEADRLAAKLKQSRSQLYSRAVREYVARHSEDDVTSALDALYANESADAGFATSVGKRVLERSEW